MEDRLEAIVATATNHFRERGYRGTRLSDVADELGVTRAAIYYYFPGKYEILERACSRGMDTAEAALARVSENGGAPSERLHEFVRLYAPIMSSDETRVFFRERGELKPSFRKALMERARRVTAGVVDLIEEGIRSGEFRGDLNPTLAANALLGMINWMSQWHQPSGSLPTSEVADTFAEIFVSGIRRASNAAGASSAAASVTADARH